MLFNSFEYIIFFLIVFILYWFVCNINIRVRNLLLLLVSYLFYGWWDWRFLSLIFASSILDFSLAILIDKSNNLRTKKVFLALSLLFNLGMLGIFKYYNFFIDSFIDFSSLFGIKVNPNSLNIILPVGISFYTFQTLSYTIDVYRKQLEPTKDIVAFFTFVSFFPQLVAGPIERAKNLLPQFYKNIKFNYKQAVDGTRQILWGFFKKVVVADNCAIYVNEIFGNHNECSSLILILGAILFAFQIYGDFSGYSDIAIGTARLLGFNLMQNFAFPYFSRDIAEFWRRWHISLSTWFRDYLYIPLGGSRTSQTKALRNIFAIFIVSGFWHGANFTFIIWGFLNALYFLPQWVRKTNRRFLGTVAEKSIFPTIRELSSILITFTLTCFAWIFFRAADLKEAFYYIYGILSFKTNNKISIANASEDIYLKYALPFFIIVLISFECLKEDNWINLIEETNNYFDIGHLSDDGAYNFTIGLSELYLARNSKRKFSLPEEVIKRLKSKYYPKLKKAIGLNQSQLDKIKSINLNYNDKIKSISKDNKEKRKLLNWEKQAELKHSLGSELYYKKVLFDKSL